MHTKKIYAEPALFSLPGWPSVESALDFLKEEARRDPEVSVRAGPLRSLFASVGVALWGFKRVAYMCAEKRGGAPFS